MKSQTRRGRAGLPGQLHRRQRRLARRRPDYTLHIPADPPAKLFWSVTVYDIDTRCLIDNEQQRGDRGSRDAELVVQPGWLGGRATLARPLRTGREANWIQTIPGQHWFSYFRFYGPLESYFDRSWKLGDITPVTAQTLED